MTSVARSLREAANVRSRIARRVILPPRPPPFIGRANDVRLLKNALRSQRVGRRIVVHGEPGVGKTWITLDVAHQVAEQSGYDIVIWLDCQQTRIGRGGALVSPPSAVRQFADLVREMCIAVEAEGALKESTSRALQMLRSQLSQRRALVLIDAFDDIADAEAEMAVLMLPDSVDVIATSRRRMQWSQEVAVRPFDVASPEFREIANSILLDQHVPITDSVLRCVLDLSAGVPQTIIWLAFLLRQGVEVDSLETELTKPESTLAQYYFERTWLELSSNDLLMKSGVLVAMARPISLNAVVAVLAAGANGQAQSKASLARLEDFNIISLSKAGLDMPVTLRQVLLNRVTQSRPEIVDDVLGWWLASLRARCEGATQRARWEDMFGEIDDFRLEIVGALRWAARSNDTEVRKRAGDVLYLAVYYLYSRGYWDVMLEAAVWLVPLHIERGNLRPAVEVNMTWSLRALRHRDGLEAAQALFESTAEQLRSHSATNTDLLDRYLSAAEGALRLKHSANPQLGSTLVDDAAAFRAAGDLEWACRAMLQAGNVWSECNATTDAMKAFEWVERNAAAAPPAPWTAEMSSLAAGNKGILQNRSSDFRAATESLEAALAGLAQTVDQATAHAELARALWEVGRIRSAKSHAALSQQLADRLGLKDSVMESEDGWDQVVGRRLTTSSVLTLFLTRWMGPGRKEQRPKA